MEDDGTELIRGVGSMPPDLSHAIVDQSITPFVVTDAGGTITWASGAVHHLSGWRPEDLVGRNMLEFVAPSEHERAMEAFAAIQHNEARRLTLPAVIELLSPTGSSIWCEVGAATIADLDPTLTVEGVVFRLRAWSHNHHFNLFLEALLTSKPFPTVATHLCRSISLALMAKGALLHHSFDGTLFHGVDGAGVPLACAPSDSGPWLKAAIDAEAVFTTVADLPPRARLAAEGPGFTSIWCVPIQDVNRRPRAVLSVWNTEAGPPLLGTLDGLAIQTRYAQLAVQRWAEHQRLIHIAGHDSLTGVANRTNFRSRLANALATGEANIALAFCDLDSFKPVNDTYGHQTGDMVLVEVAERLRRSLRAGDELGRLGGDEFTVLMRNVPDANAARQLAERILAATADPFDANGRPVEIGISVGIALVSEPTSADALLALADAALYEAKRKGGNQAHVSEA